MMLVSALVAALSFAVTGAASAQTPFQADATDTATLPAGPCSNGAYICGTADIAGYGAASWNMYITGSAITPTPCDSTYTATTYFTLAGEPGSTLVVDESGNLCGLGHDGAAYRGYLNGGPNSYGHPFAIVGNWTVDRDSSGQFSGLAGSGTDLLKLAGAHIAGTYTGMLG
jgi:hypothetical protein